MLKPVSEGDNRIQKMAHGGDRYRNQVQLDFSININPLGMPDYVKESLTLAIEEADVYPDLYQEELLEALADKFALDMEQILCGNGASELLMALVHTFHPDKVLLPVPSFSGYKWVLDAENIRVTEVLWDQISKQAFQKAWFRDESGEETHYDMIFLTNPNNPTGRYIDPDLLEKLCDYCQDKGTIIILDECFMELSDDPAGHSLITKLKRWKNLLILRAFTKSFAIPGVRVGYLLGADVRKISRISKHLPEWNLSVMAQRAGVACLQETDYLERSRAYIGKERTYLRCAMERMGFQVEASQANFILFRASDQEEEAGRYVCQELLKMGTLIRDCSDYKGLKPGTCRIAVRSHEENQKLLTQMELVMAAWKERKSHSNGRR